MKPCPFSIELILIDSFYLLLIFYHNDTMYGNGHVYRLDAQLQMFIN